MTKNKMLRIASVLLVAVLLSTCAIAGTFAKYTTETSAVASAKVAKWDFDFAGLDDSSKTFVFDLFKNVKDEDGTQEDHVKVGDGVNIIAPGTSGSFQIDLKNNSEVAAEYTIAFAIDKAGVPLKFKVNGTGDWADTIENVTAEVITMGGTATLTVEWIWAFEGDHNSLGTAETLATPSVTATITATQKN